MAHRRASSTRGRATAKRAVARRTTGRRVSSRIGIQPVPKVKGRSKRRKLSI